MNRRHFLQRAAGFVSAASLPTVLSGGGQPQIAFTFDDPTTETRGNLDWPQINERMLAALAKRKLQAALFVCGKRIDSPAGHELVSAWNQKGHLIVNHSYSHFFFNDVPLQQFQDDALKNEPLIRDYTHFSRLFRFPFFKEGDTAEKRDGMRAFLQQRGYRIGRSTIDASDWAISGRLEKRAKAAPNTDFTPYRDFFLQHIWERAQFYDSLAQRVLAQPVRHTVLLHHNALNALYIGDLLDTFTAKGWKLIDADFAYQDAVYDRQPKITIRTVTTTNLRLQSSQGLPDTYIGNILTAYR